MSELMRRDQILVAAGFAAVLGACLWVSWPALSGPFLFDDIPNLQHLSSLEGKLTWASITQYMSLFASEPGRPLSMLSFVINDFAWPSDPRSFKYTNLLLHLLNGVVIFGLARSLASSRFDGKPAAIAGLLVMAAWVLHPIQLSTSMLVIQRMTQLAALFAFAGLWSYSALVSRSNSTTAAVLAVCGLGTGTVLATLCKENGALVPLLAMVLNATLLRGSIDVKATLPRKILHLGCGLPTLALVFAIAWKWNSITNYGIRDFGMGERVLTECRVLLDYLFRIVVPTVRGSGIYHDDFPVSSSLFDPITTLPAVFAVCAAIVLSITQLRRFPIAAFGLLWFFAAHALESTVFPLEIYFEHRNYLPMFGPLLALALGAVSLARRHRGAVLLIVAWISFAAWLTWLQAPLWGDRNLLTATWAIEHPNSPRAIQQYADSLYRSGRYAEAAATLLDAYDRGLRGSDMPAQAFLIACGRNSEATAGRARPLLPASLATGEYNNSLLETMKTLRVAATKRVCPEILSEDDWLSMSSRLLANPKFSDPNAQAFIHVERAYLYRGRRNLDATMRELETAYSEASSVRLSQLIAHTLMTAGLQDDARVWLEKGLRDAPDGIRATLSSDVARSRAMIAELTARPEG